MAGRLTRKSQQTIQDLIAEENFCIIPKVVLSSLLTENSKYFDMVVELQQKTLDTFSDFTQKTTEISKNILDKSNIIIEVISNMNRNTNINIPRNDNNLDTFPKTNKEFDANVQIELQKRKRLHYQIYRAQSLSSYYQSLLNHENPFVPAKFRAKVNITTPEYEKEIRRKQSIDTMKREIDILDERRRNWLVELEQYEQAIHSIINSLNFNNEQQQLLQVKYKDKLKEDEKRNTDNWNNHFDKLKATYQKEQESNDIDNLLKYADKQSEDENVAANNNYMQKNYLGQHHRPRYRFPRKY